MNNEKYCGQPTFYNGHQLVYLGTDGNCYPVPSQSSQSLGTSTFPMGGGGGGGRGARGFQGFQGPQGAQGSGGGIGGDIWAMTNPSNFEPNTFSSFFFNQPPRILESEATFKYNGSEATLSDFSIRIFQNLSTTPSILTVRINGVDTPISIAIPAGFTGVLENLVDTAPVVNGDLITYQLSGNDAVVSLNMATIIAS